MALAGHTTPPAQEAQGQRGRATQGSLWHRWFSHSALLVWWARILQVLCGSLAADPPGDSAKGIGGLLRRDPRHHLVKGLASCCSSMNSSGRRSSESPLSSSAAV